MNFQKAGITLAGLYTLIVVSVPLASRPEATMHMELIKAKPAPLVISGLSPFRRLDNIGEHKIEAKPASTEHKIVPTKPINRGQKTDTNVVAVLEGFEVTWYNNDHSKTGGITKSGAKTQEGRTVSVDPKIIPLGTWIEIVMPDGRVLKRKAEDTGGAVNKRVLDVFADKTKAELRKLGRTRNVTVKILKGE